MSDAVESYDARGNAPGPWWWSGRNLLVAADILYQRRLNHVQFLAATPLDRGTSMAVFAPMQMLRACAIECLLKAMYLDRGNILARNGHFKKPPARDHDLVALARLAGVPDAPSTVALLAKLERFITAGRYPIETSAQRTYPEDASGVAWSDEDEAEFARLRMALFEQDARLSCE